MKHIISLGNKRYIHLDSYRTQYETGLGQFVISIFVLAIAAVTVGAMFGMDITQPTPVQNHEPVRSTNR